MGAMAPERYVRILSALSETEEGIEAETGLQTKGDEFCSDTALPPARSGRNRPGSPRQMKPRPCRRYTRQAKTRFLNKGKANRLRRPAEAASCRAVLRIANHRCCAHLHVIEWIYIIKPRRALRPADPPYAPGCESRLDALRSAQLTVRERSSRSSPGQRNAAHSGSRRTIFVTTTVMSSRTRPPGNWRNAV